MNTIFAAYISTLLTLLSLDAVWLLLVAKKFYASKLGYIMSTSPRLGAAILFYLLYSLGLVVFVIIPAQHTGSSSWRVLLMGALFGFIAYSVYDLTNLTTLEGWPVSVTVADMLWGSFLTGIAAVTGFFVANYFL